jgi:hypothetical protein
MRRGSVPRARRGIALFSAVSLLAVIGLFLAAAVANTLLRQRTARLAGVGESLSAAADYATGIVLAQPDQYALAALPYGIPQTFVVSNGNAPAIQTTVMVSRIRGGVYWLVADASAAEGHRRSGIAARSPMPGALPTAGIIARGTISLAVDVSASNDTTGDPDCRVGAAPSTAQSADSTIYFLSPAQLALLDSAPSVRHVRGDTTVAGSFEGVLIVDGAIQTSGPFAIDGLLVARGPIHSAGGLTVVGALMSFATGPTPAVDLAGSTVRFAPCEVARIFRAALPPRIIRGRGWAELF